MRNDLNAAFIIEGAGEVGGHGLPHNFHRLMLQVVLHNELLTGQYGASTAIRSRTEQQNSCLVI